MRETIVTTVLISFFLAAAMLWLVTNFRGEQQIVGIVFMSMAILGLGWGIFQLAND